MVLFFAKREKRGGREVVEGEGEERYLEMMWVNWGRADVDMLFVVERAWSGINR